MNDGKICPWDFWPQTPLGFCEESLCAWIKQPGNTWSNIGFFIVGFWILRKANSDKLPSLRLLGIASLTTGIGSAFFHATGTEWAGNADLLGMYLGTGALTALNTLRWLKTSRNTTGIIFIATTLGLIALSLLFKGSERWVYALSGPCCLIELRCFFRDRFHTEYKQYLLAWACFGAAFVMWIVDIQGFYCNPHNHALSGHALWHLLSASGFYFLYRYYRQFDVFKSKRTERKLKE